MRESGNICAYNNFHITFPLKETKCSILMEMFPLWKTVNFIIILAEVPGFARGIPMTIKYKSAILAHHERNANFVRFYDKKMHNFHMDQSIKP